MRILTAVHQPDAGPGVFAEAASERGDLLIEWDPTSFPEPAADVADPDAVVLLGGQAHPDQELERPWLRTEKDLVAGWLEARLPILGVCLGAELLSEVAGAPAQPMARARRGWHPCEATPQASDDPVFSALPARFDALHWHSYATPLPPGAVQLAGGGDGVDAFRVGPSAWGIQFHAEVTAGGLEHWIDKYSDDRAALAAGLEPERLRAQTEQRIGDWNALGRRLFDAFLDYAERSIALGRT